MFKACFKKSKLNFMKNHFFLNYVVLFFLASCSKQLTVKPEDLKENNYDNSNPAIVQYSILAGQNFSDKNGFQNINITELKFSTQFDSTAIYLTKNSSNQADINKLYGFADNNSTHQNFSARFGWRWYNNELQILAYTYNNGVVGFQKIGTASIGKKENYSIKISGNNYIFSFNSTSVNMPRASTTATAIGYKLFPYFGGSEPAPHNINILIQEQ